MTTRRAASPGGGVRGARPLVRPGWAVSAVRSPAGLITRGPEPAGMRDEEEIREQYEFLKEHLEDENMRHEGVRQMFTYYKRALGWVLEEEHI